MTSKTRLRILALAASLFAAQSALANGALAIDTNQGERYGWGVGYRSMGEAEQRARNECGAGCTIVMRFSAGCGAYAADQARGSSIYGWATAPTGSGAQNTALSECRNRGGNSCLVRVWGCNGR